MKFCSIDIGNTFAKFCLIDKELEVLSTYSCETEQLFFVEMWDYLLNGHLETVHSDFKNSKLLISCVSWKAFLALRVFLGYDNKEDFDINKVFEEHLLSVPKDSPVIFENAIPLKRDGIEGAIGTDRLLSAYAIWHLYAKNAMIVSLGTATTIDVVQEDGTFLSGLICAGLESSYQGLINRASHLPKLKDLPYSNNFINNNVPMALSAGLFLGHKSLIESFYAEFEPIPLFLIGGNAEKMAQYITLDFEIKNNLVCLGLVILYLENEGT